MKRLATATAALGLVLASAGFAAAERPDTTDVSRIDFGTQVEVRAGDLYQAKELQRAGLKADDVITVTKADRPSVVFSQSNDDR